MMNLAKILSKSFLFIHEIEFKTYIYILFDITFLAKTLAIKLLSKAYAKRYGSIL